MQDQNTDHPMAPVWEPCGQGCACNSLTSICWGPVDVAPCCAFCGHAGATDVYREEDYPDAPCCADEDACHARVIS